MTLAARRAAQAVVVLTVSGLMPVAAGAAGPLRYVIDPAASEIRFKATSRLMDADGTFHRFSGEVVADPGKLATARLTITVAAASIDTGIRMRDSHLRSDDFLDVERHPAIRFESVRVEPRGGHLTVVGNLSMRGVTREIAVPVEAEVGERTLIARGEFVLNRRDYGVSYQSRLNPIADAVRVGFSIRARPAGP